MVKHCDFQEGKTVRGLGVKYLPSATLSIALCFCRIQTSCMCVANLSEGRLGLNVRIVSIPLHTSAAATLAIVPQSVHLAFPLSPTCETQCAMITIHTYPPCFFKYKCETQCAVITPHTYPDHLLLVGLTSPYHPVILI